MKGWGCVFSSLPPAPCPLQPFPWLCSEQLSVQPQNRLFLRAFHCISMPAHPEAARFFLQDAPVLAVRVLQVLTVKFLLLELQLLAKPEDRPIPALVPSPFSTICSALGSRPRRSPASCPCWQGCAAASAAGSSGCELPLTHFLGCVYQVPWNCFLGPGGLSWVCRSHLEWPQPPLGVCSRGLWGAGGAQQGLAGA